MTFRDLLAEHVLASLERQEHAEAVIGNRSWSVDLDAATVVFEGGPTAEIALLGTESARDGSWLWAWANESLVAAETVLAASRRLPELGRGLGVSELESPRFMLDELRTVHSLGMVTSGLLGADAYYIAPTGEARALMTMRAPEFVVSSPDASVVTRTILSGIGMFELEHPPVIAAYLERRGCSVEVDVEGSRWHVGVPTGERLTLSFDPRGRLTHAEADRSVAGPPVADAVIEVRRTTSMRRDAVRRYRLLIDGVEVERLKRGQSVRIPLAPGTHEVQMAIDAATSPPLVLPLSPGEVIGLVCEPAAGARQSRDYIERPGSYIRLEIDDDGPADPASR